MSKLQQIQQGIEAVRIDNLKGVNRQEIEKQLITIETLVHELMNLGERENEEIKEEEEKPHPHKATYNRFKGDDWVEWDELPFMTKTDIGALFDQIEKLVKAIA